ncbi:MAG: TonB-dependent siderophore receptor [Verrucomicrobia bacterium]|nr:TonB-dependent siderophore receptor [Verrucomicrobiota bacterium]
MKPDFASDLSSSSRSASALAALIVTQGLASTAHAGLGAADAANTAADAPTQLGAVSVEEKKETKPSLPKFTEPLRDTPQTVAVIPSEVFLQQGAANLSDVLRNTSGITFAAGEGGSAAGTAGDAFYMRGFDTSNNIFVDGVRDVGAYSRDVYNLEQVEVAKGPAGADIGRGGASGYVNVSTKVPRLEAFTAANVTYGFDEQTSGSRRRTSLDVNQPVENSPVRGTAVRINALWQDNDVVGRDYAENKSWAIAPSLALGLGTPTRATLAYQHTEQDNRPDYGLPTAQLPGYISAVPVPSVDRSTFYGFTVDSDKVSSDAVVARLERDVTGDLKLSNQTRYSANQREAVVTTPGSSGAAYVPATGLLTRSRQANKRDLSILSNQTNVTARVVTGPLSHNFTGGLELSRETAYNPAFTSVTLPAILIQNPDPGAAPALTPFRSGAYTDVTTKTAALYLFDTVHFSPRWQANASLRAERYQTHYLSMAATGAATLVDARKNLVSWKSGLVFKPVTAGSLYAAYATSLTPPGTDFTLSSAVGNQNNPDTDPQETSNLELGVKWDFFHGRLSTNFAVFKTVNDKTVYTDPLLGPIPAGKQTVQGFELGATRRITDNWLVLASVSFLDSEINAGTTTGGNLAGSALPLIPRWSGNLYTSYRFHSGLILGGGGQYSDEVARRDNNTPAVPRTSPSYWLFNAVVSYPVVKNVTLRLNVNNLFDRIFVQSANNNGARFTPGAPRAYTLSADLRF